MMFISQEPPGSNETTPQDSRQRSLKGIIMSNAQNTAFEQLLSGWRRHEQLRTTGASFEQLTESRRVLDEYRYIVATAR